MSDAQRVVQESVAANGLLTTGYVFDSVYVLGDSVEGLKVAAARVAESVKASHNLGVVLKLAAEDLPRAMPIHRDLG